MVCNIKNNKSLVWNNINKTVFRVLGFLISLLWFFCKLRLNNYRYLIFLVNCRMNLAKYTPSLFLLSAWHKDPIPYLPKHAHTHFKYTTRDRSHDYLFHQVFLPHSKKDWYKLKPIIFWFMKGKCLLYFWSDVNISRCSNRLSAWVPWFSKPW